MLTKAKEFLLRKVFKSEQKSQNKRYNIEEYFNNFDGSDELNLGMCTQNIGGLSLKRFVRFDSDKFKELISELRTNANCSYKTYFNNLIINDNYTPEYLSTLMKVSKTGIMKSVYSDYFIDAEIVASRLANMLQIPTAYNIKYEDDDYKYLLSVDVVEPEHFIHNIMELAYEPRLSEYQTIREAVYLLYTTLTGNNEYGIRIDHNTVSKIISEFIPMAMFRIETMNDIDFFNNIFVLSNGKEWKLAPMIDCECSLATATELEVIEKDAEYLLERYPEEYLSYIEKLKNINFNDVKKEFDSAFSDEKHRRINFEVFKENVYNILSVYKKLTTERGLQKL